MHFNDLNSIRLQCKIEPSRWLLLQCEETGSSYFVLLNLLNISLVKFTFKNVGECAFDHLPKSTAVISQSPSYKKGYIKHFGIRYLWHLLILLCSLQAFKPEQIILAVMVDWIYQMHWRKDGEIHLSEGGRNVRNEYFFIFLIRSFEDMRYRLVLLFWFVFSLFILQEWMCKLSEIQGTAHSVDLYQ